MCEMETLNMSKLNLSSVQSHNSKELVVIPATSNSTLETDDPVESDNDNNCEYHEDIWHHLLEQEAEKPIIHLQSPQLEFRGSLVQQLREVTKQLKLSMCTLHSAVLQLDLFMDAHRLRADRLTHVALACLSLAAKCGEKFSRAPTLKTLSNISGVQLCGKTFRQLEWMVGQHVRWRLLAPTQASFALLLAQYVVTDSDLTVVPRHPKFVRRFKKDGAQLLDAYLDLTLSNVRLRLLGGAAVGCACVASARASLGLPAWPAWLASAARPAGEVLPVARILQRMMKCLISRAEMEPSDADQGYGSARTSPNLTPCASPRADVSPASSSTSLHLDNYRNNAVPRAEHDNHSALDTDDGQPLESRPYVDQDRRLPEITRVSSALELKFCRSRRLIEASLNSVQPNMAVKRSMEANGEVDRKRYRLTTQLSQVVI